MSEIKVVPCPAHEGKFAVLRRNQKFIQFLFEGWCGTEAEALAKAAELRTIEENKQWASEGSRPVETRPPAPCGKRICDMVDLGNPVRVSCALDAGHEGWCSSRRPDPEPVEQAAPPRPKCQVCGTELTNFPWTGWGCDKCNCPRCHCHGLSRSYGKECNQPAPAAIEQARPHPPEIDKLFSYKPIYPEMAYNTKNMTESAAAEPAPERTPPTWTLEQIQKAIRSIGKDFANYDGNPEPHCSACKRDEAIVEDVATEIERYLAARAVAVPEPAQTVDAEQWWKANVKKSPFKMSPANIWKYMNEFASSRVPEPAAQQECPIQGMDTCKEIISTVVNHLMTTGQLSSAIHDEALLQKVGQLMPRTWEPAPTPSRWKNPYIAECLAIQDCITIVEGEWRRCQKSDMETFAFQIARNALVAHLSVAETKRKTWAEASALGAKEE